MLSSKSVAAFISTVALATKRVEGLVARSEATEDLLRPPQGSDDGAARRTPVGAPRIVLNSDLTFGRLN